MTGETSLPDGVLLAFYGDDFTGSSAVMEVMTFAGLPAVMFVEPPTPAQLQRFSNYRAIGIASVARAQSPSWMDAHLPRAFRATADHAHHRLAGTQCPKRVRSEKHCVIRFRRCGDLHRVPYRHAIRD